jgi:hypothetical protein
MTITLNISTTKALGVARPDPSLLKTHKHIFLILGKAQNLEQKQVWWFRASSTMDPVHFFLGKY